MSGGFPIGGAVSNPSSSGTVLSGFHFGGTIITPGATANTKGSWTQIVASTSSDCDLLHLKITGESGGGTYKNQFIDVGVGVAGSEVVVFPNIDIGVGGTFQGSHVDLLVPIHIPAGSRIAARAQADAASISGDFGVSLVVYDAAFETQAFAGVDDIGTATSTTQGTVVALGNATKGSYAQLVASSAKDYEGLAVILDSDKGTSLAASVIDIAIGAAGSEVILMPDLICNGFQSDWQLTKGFIPMQIPAGTRIAARGASLSGGTANVGVACYGLWK